MVGLTNDDSELSSHTQRTQRIYEFTNLRTQRNDVIIG